jgi:hypothetical protein
MNRNPGNDQYFEELEYQRSKVAKQYPDLTRQEKVALLQIREEVLKHLSKTDTAKSRAVLPLAPETNNETLSHQEQLGDIMEALKLGKKTTEVKNILNSQMKGGRRKTRARKTRGRRKTKARKTRGRK